jgi:hypothetical protein
VWGDLVGCVWVDVVGVVVFYCDFLLVVGYFGVAFCYEEDGWVGKRGDGGGLGDCVGDHTKFFYWGDVGYLFVEFGVAFFSMINVRFSKIVS